MNPQQPAVEFVNFPRLAQMFYLEPLALEESAMLAIHAYLWPRLTNNVSVMEPESRQPVIASKGMPLTHGRTSYLGPTRSESGAIADARYYQTLPDKPHVAVLPIRGALMRQASAFQEACTGAISAERISHAISQVKADKSVSRVVLDIRSPGGDANIGELSAQIRDLAQMRSKMVYAFTDGVMASAAYRLGSQANEIIMTPGGRVGSIGTYLAFLNENVRMQMQGAKMEIFKAGSLKAMGMPGVELTQEARNYLQQGVDDLNAQFVGEVQKARPRISEEAVTKAAMYPGASTIPGASAIDHRMADGIVSSWEEFIALL